MNERDERGPLERAYDAEIAPLMTQIIAACKRAKIPVVAGFQLDFKEDEDQHLTCTTFVHGPDWKPNDEMFEANRALNPPPLFARHTIITRDPKAGS